MSRRAVLASSWANFSIVRLHRVDHHWDRLALFTASKQGCEQAGFAIDYPDAFCFPVADQGNFDPALPHAGHEFSVEPGEISRVIAVLDVVGDVQK